MTVRTRVEQWLRGVSPKPVCDDCIAQALDLSSRQQAYQETRLLDHSSGFDKLRRACSDCGRLKLATRCTGASDHAGAASPRRDMPQDKLPLSKQESPPRPQHTSARFQKADANFGKACAVPERTLFLVSCVKTKGSSPAKAKDLYASAWFTNARARVEGTGCAWRILSARYGLVDPEEEISPYEQALNNMGVAVRRNWAEQVLKDLTPCLEGIDTVVFFAGKKYREHLCPALLSRNLQVHVPMARLPWGEQLSWLNSYLHG